MPVKAGVIRAGARNTRRGAAETFTGVVFQDPVITAEAPSRLGGSVVTFTPGARTAWHSHPVGQTLFCLSGVGRICFKGEKPQVLNPGDTVNIPPDTMHWHGACPIACSHIWRCRKPATRVKAPLGALTSATLSTTRRRAGVEPRRASILRVMTGCRVARSASAAQGVRRVDGEGLADNQHVEERRFGSQVPSPSQLPRRCS